MMDLQAYNAAIGRVMDYIKGILSGLAAIFIAEVVFLSPTLSLSKAVKTPDSFSTSLHISDTIRFLLERNSSRSEACPARGREFQRSREGSR